MTTCSYLCTILLDPRCPGNQVVSKCSTTCGISCENYHLPPHLQPLCDEFCTEGCACPPGLIPLSADPQNTECVAPDECPQLKCPPTQAFTDCATSCGISCLNYHFPSFLQPVCFGFCFPGCFCKEGLIPLGNNPDICVRPDHCPTAVCSRERQRRPCQYV